MKKSQIYSHVFIYILTIILTSIILIYGYNTIKDFRQAGERICLLKFENELRNIVEAMSSDFGSIKRKDIQLCGYAQACFVETSVSPEEDDLPFDLDPIIRDSIKSKTGKNAFILADIAEESFYAGNISVEPDDVLCIKPTNDKISLRLEGRGSHVLLREWKQY